MKAKVLIAHNYYSSGSPSGEGRVVEIERELLEKNGHETVTFSRTNDELIESGLWGTLKGAASVPWNPFTANKLRKAVVGFSPDVVHVHNTFPLISPAVFTSTGNNAARVLTLHNYRLFCAAAVPMRDGSVCTECLKQHSSWPALQHGCYRDSKAATLPLAFSIELHRKIGTWSKNVDAFIALSDFQRNLMIEAGLPEDLVHVKPHFYPGKPNVVPWSDKRPTVVYAGRLSSEKGVKSLLSAWIMWGEIAPDLLIIGDGELRQELQQMAAMSPHVPIKFLGKLPHVETIDEIAHASLLVFPSVGIETFGLTILEAFAHGTPVATSDVGPLPSIVCQNVSGLVFSNDSAESLLEVIKTNWNEVGKLEQMGAGARLQYEKRYTDNANYTRLIEIYNLASEVRDSRNIRVSN